MAKSKYIEPIPIEVEVDGKIFLGSYRQHGSVLTAEWDDRTETTQVGANAESTAKQLLRELVRKNR